MSPSRQSKPLRVLITSFRMDNRGGWEVSVRDLALGLLARGHQPIVYSPTLGTMSDELQEQGVPVTDNLDRVHEKPDVIHGQQFVPAAEAIIRFPDTPAVYICRGVLTSMDAAPDFPQIRQYAAIAEACRDRLIFRDKIDPSRVMLLFNGTDLTRFPARPRPLEQRPRRALLFHKDRAHVPMLRAACERVGIELSELGRGSDRVIARPELELVKYDLVFAIARCAIEAICAGAAVIPCDATGMAGLVTSDNWRHYRKNNFAFRILDRPLSVGAILEQIGRYDAADANAVSASVRAEANLADWLDAVESIYYRIIDEHAVTPIAPETHRQALLRFLNKALPRRRDQSWPWRPEDFDARLNELDQQLARARDEAVTLRAELERIRRSRILRLYRTIRRGFKS